MPTGMVWYRECPLSCSPPGWSAGPAPTAPATAATTPQTLFTEKRKRKKQMLTMKAVGTMVHKTFKNCSGLEANCLVWVKKRSYWYISVSNETNKA